MEEKPVQGGCSSSDVPCSRFGCGAWEWGFWILINPIRTARQAAEIATARLRALRRMRGVADAAARCAAAATSVGAQAEGHVQRVEEARRDAAAKETYYWRLRSTIPRNDEEKYFERCLKAAKEGARRTCRRRRPRGA